MNTSLVASLTRRVENARQDLERAIQGRNRNELLCYALDQRPLQHLETSSSLFTWRDSLSVSIFYLVPSIRDMVEVIEFFEDLLGVEAKSYDSEETGTRVFNFDAIETLAVSVSLFTSPDEQSGDATCRRVVVGEDVVTERRPRYEIRCN
jgi:hypothetical protein